MLEQPMMDKLAAMRLYGMLDALEQQHKDPGGGALSLLERLALLVDHQWIRRQNQALARRLQAAKLRGNACVEDIDFRAARGFDESVIRGLAKDSQWVKNQEHVIVLGPTGVGKKAWAKELCRFRVGAEGLLGWLHGLLCPGGGVVP